MVNYMNRLLAFISVEIDLNMLQKYSNNYKGSLQVCQNLTFCQHTFYFCQVIDSSR